MTREREKTLVRIEAKLNILIRASAQIAAYAVGFGVYFSTQKYEWAVFYGLVAGAAAGYMVESELRALEKRISYDDDYSD